MMMFGAKDMQLKQWTVTDPQGYDTTVAVYNLDTTQAARPEPVPDRLHAQRSFKCSASQRPSCRGRPRRASAADRIASVDASGHARLDAGHRVTHLRLRACTSRSPPGTSTRSGCASIWSRSFIKAVRPDVLCLQETKCPDDAFPLKRFKRLGYEHVALNGQKGYHGVAVLSRLPFERIDDRAISAARPTAATSSVVLGEQAGLRDPITLHNFYVPAGGDEPDPEINPKFAHKLAFLDEMRAHAKPAPGARASAPSWSAISTSRRSSTTSGATSRCSRWSRTRRSNARSSTAAQKAGNWIDAMRVHHAGAGEALHLVELSRAGQLARRRPRPPARSHLGLARARRRACRAIDDRQGLPRRRAAVRPRAGDGDASSFDAIMSALLHAPRRSPRKSSRPAAEPLGHHVAQAAARLPDSLPAS